MTSIILYLGYILGFFFMFLGFIILTLFAEFLVAVAGIKTLLLLQKFLFLCYIEKMIETGYLRAYLIEVTNFFDFLLIKFLDFCGSKPYRQRTLIFESSHRA